MPSRELDALLIRNAERTDAITAAFEKELARRYREAYQSIEAELAKLFAKIGATPTLREARRFNRLSSLQKAIAAEYKAMTREAIIGTRNNSARVFANGVYGTQWAYDQAIGVEIKWPVLSVEAIRQSVWDGVTGENFSQRLREWNTKELIALNQKITSGLAQGFGFSKVARSVKKEVNDDYSRIIRIVRTEATRNYSQGHLATYDNLEKVGIEARKQWVSTLDTRTRDSHGSLDGTFADDDGLFYSSGGSAEAPGLFGIASEDINCIPEYAIPICMNTEKLYKRYYSGSIVIIKTASGNEIHVTPNHPILTDKGWVTAKSIVKDSNVCSVVLGEIFGSGNPNVNNKPPIAAEILNLFSIVGSVKWVGGVDKQFHGDGSARDGNVDIVSIDGKLRNRIESFIYKPLKKFSFTAPKVLHIGLPSNSPFLQFGITSRHAFNGFMGLARKFASLFSGAISHALKHCRRPSVDINTMACQYSPDPSAMDVKRVCDAFFGFSADVSFDNVVSIESVPYTGHVYNLQTEQGWYGLYHDNGNMSIVHNCRCRIIEVIDDMSPELRRIRGEGIVPYTTFSDWAKNKGWSPTRGWDIEKKAILAEKQAMKY